ncbi:IclR family transcriptional regulator [Microbacterium horticulturae]|uniref:IclR family transcriptional regulator n=1 Tax=Microbacterium horticulturae TaxID=3028316 RepID=A0ABY8BUZ6_9MICO|nr:IclR family transcriptional regulator [Microbacterium sp. KACC 23027]WEG07989.1 IclR family transcriptional regulator [Microbacterium sp. KACC 23027]
MARASGGESALRKHLRVLDAFDAFHPYLTLARIAEIAGLAPSSAHRLVAQLEAEGLLERMPDRSYRLGVRLWEFAARTPSALGLRELARPWMSGVHARIRQHTQLAVRSGRDVLFIERMSTPDAVVNATLIGGRTPLPVSSSGLVLLAHADESVVDEVVDAGWPRFTAHTLRDGVALHEQLRHVRVQGFADLPGHIHEGSRGIAVPVRGPQEVVHAALGVVVGNDGAPAQAIVELLTVAAAGITRALQDAYLAVDGSGRRRPGPVVSGSRASLDYFTGRDEHDPVVV